MGPCELFHLKRNVHSVFLLNSLGNEHTIVRVLNKIRKHQCTVALSRRIVWLRGKRKGGGASDLGIAVFRFNWRTFLYLAKLKAGTWVRYATKNTN